MTTTNELVIWSRFGLWRTTTAEELRSGTVVDRSVDEVEEDLAEHGYCLAFCDTERVAILPCCPEDALPGSVDEWLAEPNDED